jgi:hypothetical protein
MNIATDDLIESYRPFIADVPRSARAEPFPLPDGDSRTDEEIEQTKARLRHKISKVNFNPPIPLSDFCLIAQERWDREESGGSCPAGGCLLW